MSVLVLSEAHSSWLALRYSFAASIILSAILTYTVHRNLDRNLDPQSDLESEQVSEQLRPASDSSDNEDSDNGVNGNFLPDTETAETVPSGTGSETSSREKNISPNPSTESTPLSTQANAHWMFWSM